MVKIYLQFFWNNRRPIALGFVACLFSSTVIALLAPRFSSAWAPAMVLIAWPIQGLVGWIMGALGFLNPPTFKNPTYTLSCEHEQGFVVSICDRCHHVKEAPSVVKHWCTCEACLPHVWYECAGCGQRRMDVDKIQEELTSRLRGAP